MKKIKFVFAALALAVLLSSCFWDLYSGKRPSDYGDGEWVCEEMNIRFTVDTLVEGYYDPWGEIELDGEMYPCQFYFINQTDRLFLNVYESENITNSNRIGQIDCNCDFPPTKWWFI